MTLDLRSTYEDKIGVVNHLTATHKSIARIDTYSMKTFQCPAHWSTTQNIFSPIVPIGVGKPWSNLLTNASSVCNSVSVYNSPPIQSLTSSSMNRHHYYQQFPSSSTCGINSTASSFDDCSLPNIPETHKSMWVLNPLYASTSGKNLFFSNLNCRF